MKKVKLVCNPVHTPAKFPADVRYLYTAPGEMVDDKKAETKAKIWAEKHNMLIIRMHIEDTEGPTAGAEGDTI